MFQSKVNALQRIKEEAENAALDHNFDTEMGKRAEVLIRFATKIFVDFGGALCKVSIIGKVL